jgi:hypothetical protein
MIRPCSPLISLFSACPSLFGPFGLPPLPTVNYSVSFLEQFSQARHEEGCHQFSDYTFISPPPRGGGVRNNSSYVTQATLYSQAHQEERKRVPFHGVTVLIYGQQLSSKQNCCEWLVSWGVYILYWKKYTALSHRGRQSYKGPVPRDFGRAKSKSEKDLTDSLYNFLVDIFWIEILQMHLNPLLVRFLGNLLEYVARCFLVPSAYNQELYSTPSGQS